MVTMVAIQFLYIIAYQFITYVHGGVIRSKMHLSVNILKGWVTRLHNRSQHQEFQLQNRIRDNIPEVAFNYDEYREPLVGCDYQ